MAKKDIVDRTIIHEKKIENIFSDAFGRYAKYIIQDRALPDIRDGLKPVQRRIVYAMNDLGIVHDKDYKKSARSVGEVIGKYHPHGDSSIYDAMVRMSQDWKNNIPLIDMHGNNGSIDNDPAAAMRYTESRLSLYAETLITDIKKKIVPFIENFDGSEEEPTVLPSLMPNLLINGASGIAAGYATNIPPFNPGELLDALIKRIDSPECRIETILNAMPGPDFPTGGVILNKENMKDIYETGRGRIFIRSKIELRTKKQAFITEIPYEVNKADLIDEINDCAEKFDTLNIKECHDETDQNGLSICINLSDTENFEFVKNFLFKNTSLQISYNFNMIAIKDRKPCMFSIPVYLDSFIQHCENVVLNSTKFDLAEVKKRKEVVVGLIKAIKMIDVIIELIKKSANKQNAKEKLIAQHKFSEVQAESIVSLRLYSLSNSDVTALEKELLELNKLIEEYTKIINDKNYRNLFIKNIFRGFKKLFKFPRRTQFSEESVANLKIESSEVVEDKEVYLVVTKDGYVKNVPQRSFESSVYDEIGLKENDVQIFQAKTSQKNKLIFVTNKGNYFATQIHKIESGKWKDDGIHLNSFVELQPEEHVINCFIYNEKENENKVLVIASKKNMIKRTMLDDLSVSRLNKPSTIMGLDDNDEVVSCLLTIKNDAPEANDLIGAVTKTGSVLLYPINQINIIGRNGSGVKNINTTEDIASIFIDNPTNAFLILGSSQGAKKIKRELLPVGKRTGKAKPMIASTKINVISSFEANNTNTINVLYDDKFVFTLVKDITVGNANTKVFPIRGHKIIALNNATSFNEIKKDDTNEEISLFDK